MGSQEYLRVVKVKCMARLAFNSKVPFFKQIPPHVPVGVFQVYKNDSVIIGDEAHCTVREKCPISQFCPGKGRISNILFERDLSNLSNGKGRIREIQFTPVK
ncbi:MAG: hypothetical protein US75_C0020G0008 [Candidatus Woesebacteria bacterium GW2011_GWC1_38_13]|uniref:Uncharacterized protein n=3 Tax=Candidatus Woeseibacteriota TaxID=1752722 RepID=A0A0G0P0C5_9BACT|nr:MAG: hypothetical protein US67_C0030G0009 [Candidatus Woesebacteria bacterium GW2011_GWD1_38_10]KKQ55489.1 MAG: hypothetical protein US75_C0020G0008 [Candidatus Woesebacteria bacterium GW2011_GWC1_38_13]KKQ82766.1 MAG: hypothetical protein UT06_C0037G0002 [Candidatus Woesebacteria bacterium GW2011_GWA1_38_8]